MIGNIQYAVEMKAPYDMTEKDYANGNMLCEKINGIRYGIWFESLEEAKEACIIYDGYGVIESEELEYVWKNPSYKSKSIQELGKVLGKILLPH